MNKKDTVKEEVKKIVELFLNDKNSNIIALNNFKIISRQYGLSYTNKQIKDML